MIMKKISAILPAVLLLAACNDGFLDKKPLDKMSELDVFNNEALAEAHVNSFYAVLQDPFQEGNIGCITDEAYFRYGGTSTRYIADGRMDPDNVMYIREGGFAHDTRTTILNIWNRSYEFIRNMNKFIGNIEAGTEMGKEAADRLLGETYYLRAWTYANLVQRYGGVPIIDHVFGLNDDFTVERGTFDDCVDFILKDLEAAETLVPAKENASKGRINKDICKALRSRITLIAASPLFNDPAQPQNCIFRGKYDPSKWNRALEAAKAIVDRADVDGAYALDDTYDGFWKDSDSPELIWAKYFVATADSDDNTTKEAQLLYSVVWFNGWTAMEPTQAMVMDYEMANGKKFFEEGSGYDPQHPYDGRDPRFYYSIAHPFCDYPNTDNTGFHHNVLDLGVYYKNGTRSDFEKGKKFPDYTETGKHLWSATSGTGLELMKWYIPTSPITEAETGSLLYPWFRLAEFYLNYAECAYQTGDEETCRRYINKVRSRADVMMPPVTESGQALHDRLVNERRVEFAFETMRYFDLRRWKLAEFYENIPFAGTMAMIMYKERETTDGSGNKAVEMYDCDTLYRCVRLYDPAKNNTNYYTEGQVYDYSWLGKTYRIDFGDCPLGFSPTQKNFPKVDGVYPNYLMPVPRNEITKSMGSIEQNPGYK